jgi:hypothetical protein
MREGSNMKIIFTRLIAVSIVWVGTLSPGPMSSAMADISHVHQIEIFKNRIILGTHEGLFNLKPAGKFSKIGSSNFDVMGLAVSGSKIYASGHPGTGDTRPGLLGLLLSNDGGVSWKQVSLLGKVDFHLLEVSGDVVIGGDSASGELFYSDNAGKSWRTRGKNIFQALAISPNIKGSAFAISERKLFSTTNGFATRKLVRNLGDVSDIAWVDGGLYIAQGNKLSVSQDSGKSWRKKFKFKDAIDSIRAEAQTLIVTTGSEIYRSDNGGKSFSLLD